MRESDAPSALLAGEPVRLPIPPGILFAPGVTSEARLREGPLPIHEAAGIAPLGDGGDSGAVPPGTERVENAMGVIGFGLALLLAVCALLIAVRGRKR